MALGVAAPGWAQPGVPPEVQLPLLLKVMSFDRALVRRAGGGIRVAVLYQRLYPESADCAQALLAAAAHTELKTVSGIPFRLEAYALDDGGLTRLDSLQTEVVYVAPVRGLDVRALSRVCRARGWLSLAALPEYLALGLSVAIDRRGDRPLIAVNLEAARSEGAELSSRLLALRVVKVIRP